MDSPACYSRVIQSFSLKQKVSSDTNSGGSGCSASDKLGRSLMRRTCGDRRGPDSGSTLERS